MNTAYTNKHSKQVP